MAKHNKYEMDMTRGPLLSKILLFSLPLMASSILQLFFNAADIIVVGRFDAAGSTAIGAIGSTSALINLMINVFLGLSIGANVVIARYVGAGNYKDASEAVHTSVTISIIGGLFLAVFGFTFCRTFLTWMGSPEDVLPLSTLYMRVYFLGMPFNCLYNFGSAVLRSIGDTKRPLIFLAIAGVVNVVLNMIFIIVFNMGVAGVALATILSQGISASLVLICLLRSEGLVHVDIKKLHVHLDKLKQIAAIGLPAGLQGVCFSLSNVLIQSTINSFGTATVSANSVSSNIEGFVWVAMNAVHQAAVTFTSQNVGAHHYRRIRRIGVTVAGTVFVIGLVLGLAALLAGNFLIGIYTSDAEVMALAKVRLSLILPTYCLCGLMDTVCGVLRGMGKTILPTVVTLLGACAFRILWIVLVMPTFHEPFVLYLSYPISWIITACVHIFCYFRTLREFPLSEDVPEDAVKAA